MPVTRYVRDKNVRVQRRHIKHLKEFNVRYQREKERVEIGGKSQVRLVAHLANYRKEMLDAFDKFVMDKLKEGKAVRGFDNAHWRQDALQAFDNLKDADYNVETGKDTVQITDGYKKGGNGKYRLKLRYEPKQRMLTVYMRGIEIPEAKAK